MSDHLAALELLAEHGAPLPVVVAASEVARIDGVTLIATTIVGPYVVALISLPADVNREHCDLLVAAGWKIDRDVQGLRKSDPAYYRWTNKPADAIGVGELVALDANGNIVPAKRAMASKDFSGVAGRCVAVNPDGTIDVALTGMGIAGGGNRVPMIGAGATVTLKP